MDIQLLNQVEKQSIDERQPLPERYLRLSDDEMDERIAATKRALGDRLEMAWRELGEMGLDMRRTIPVTYINSSAAIKASVGAHDGVVCTSSNAAKVMAWALQRGDRLLMLPDQHLGRNTGYKLGIR